MDRIYIRVTSTEGITLILVLIMMKTLFLTLLLVCCCDAINKALSAAPENCCFNFSTKPLPPKRMSDITMTHSSCMRPAFIVKTVKGREICYRQSFPWALNVYKQHYGTEGSAQHH